MAAPNTPSPRALVALTALSASSALLAVWQWMELLVVKAGGAATCTFSSTVDCAQVWQSDFAGRVHDALGLPIAGLGLEWALAAFALSLWLTFRAAQGAETRELETSIKVWAALGFLSCITFAVATVRIGVVCPTCLVTYTLTAGFAAVAFTALPGPRAPDVVPMLKGLPRALVFAVPLHLALLYPASHTPKSTGTAMVKSDGPSDAQVAAYFERLTPPEQQATAEARAEWLRATVPDFPVPPTRERWGPENAPVKLVEFTDVLCGHCRLQVQMLHELEKALPPGRLSIEPRYFPLDGECNPAAGPPKGDGVRCLGAKVELCLEGRNEYWQVRDALFEHQTELTPDKIVELAMAAVPGLSRDTLMACVADPKTSEKLEADIAWAMAYRIEGTPLVLLNGKATEGVGPWLFGMAMSSGDANSKYFSKLPTR